MGEEDLCPNERFLVELFRHIGDDNGVCEHSVNAITGSARATCQLPYVFGAKVDDILPALRNNLDINGLKDIEICSDDRVRFAAPRQDADNFWVKRFLTSVEKKFESSCAFIAQSRRLITQ